MIWKLCTILATASVLAACASSAKEPETTTSATPAKTERAARTPRKGLEPQALAGNECGLFLWSKTDPNLFIFFARAGEGTAEMMLDDERLSLVQVASGGSIFGQFFTVQTYQTSTGREIHLTFDPGDELQEGQRIANGRFQYLDAEGWVTVLPVIGVRVCQPVVKDAPGSVQVPSRS